MPPNFTEYYQGKTGLTVGIKNILFSGQSPYQKVEIYETDTWGRMLVIDGMVMLSEKDEFVYHEMLCHVPMFTHPNPERVLIIGGGDGGTAREVLRHPSVQHLDLVEIDETVVQAAKEFLGEVGDWENPKLQIRFEDGTHFVKSAPQTYDVILIDGSDPAGPAKELFSKAFLQNCFAALRENGVLAAQSESPWVGKYQASIKQLYKNLDNFFAISHMYLASIPLYPTGLWSFLLGSKQADPLSEATIQRLKNEITTFGSHLRYYNENIHKGCFTLPNFVRNIIS